MANEEVVPYQRFEYRVQGREMHRRPLDRDGLSAWQAAWEVMNKEEHFIPAAVQTHFSQPVAGRD
jgi:hypothetical protein